MIVVLFALMMPSSASPQPCIAWRDPMNGKILDARGAQDRDAAARRELLTTEARTIGEVRVPLQCARRRGDPAPADTVTAPPFKGASSR